MMDITNPEHWMILNLLFSAPLIFYFLIASIGHLQRLREINRKIDQNIAEIFQRYEGIKSL